MFGKKQKEAERKKLELIKYLLEFQVEMINRVKIACEKSEEDPSPKVYKDGFDKIYRGVTFQSPNGLLVKFTDYVEFEQIEVFDSKKKLYRGIIDKEIPNRRPFAIGELFIGEFGIPVEFPRLDKVKPAFRIFSGTEEEISMLQYLLEETKVLEPLKNSSTMNNNGDDDKHKGIGSM